MECHPAEGTDGLLGALKREIQGGRFWKFSADGLQPRMDVRFFCMDGKFICIDGVFGAKRPCFWGENIIDTKKYTVVSEKMTVYFRQKRRILE